MIAQAFKFQKPLLFDIIDHFRGPTLNYQKTIVDLEEAHIIPTMITPDNLQAHHSAIGQ
jgi:hypothetical protein